MSEPQSLEAGSRYDLRAGISPDAPDEDRFQDDGKGVFGYCHSYETSSRYDGPGLRIVLFVLAKRALLVLDAVFIRGVGRNADPEVVTTSGFEGLYRRHRGSRLDLAVEGAADHVSLLFGCQP